MTARIANVTFHAADPAALARFWAAVMGYPEPEWLTPEEESELRAAGLTDDDLAARAVAWDEDPAHQRFYFTRYRHDKLQRNRMHIDITPPPTATPRAKRWRPRPSGSSGWARQWRRSSTDRGGRTRSSRL